MDPARARLHDRAHAPASPSRCLVVHYHEIGLKGRNRGFFERRLVSNVEAVLRGTTARVEVVSGRLIVHIEDAADERLAGDVAAVFGVASCAPAVVVEPEIDAMREAALGLLEARSFRTFAIAARRATKELPLTSREINVELGSAVREATGAGVDLGSPDVTVRVEVVGRRAFVYVDRITGAGGLPVGVSGKVVVLLSGGIDSPVAAYRVLRRGAKGILCHFHSAPFTDTSSARKARELASSVAGWQGRTTLYLVPLGEAQQEIVGAAPPQLRVVLYRRLMARIAQRVAAGEGAKALVLGDSLGQVASQTIENISCVDAAVDVPVLRPLIGDDKQAIVEEAKRLGTYETSIQPFADCCSLFVPRSPATRATPAECEAAEAGLDMAALVSSCLQAAEVERIAPPPGDAR